MKNVDSLVSEAAGLAESGLSRGEIADELNVSRETSSWLIERPTTDPGESNNRVQSPHDIHIDWSTVGENQQKLEGREELPLAAHLQGTDLEHSHGTIEQVASEVIERYGAGSG